MLQFSTLAGSKVEGNIGLTAEYPATRSKFHVAGRQKIIIEIGIKFIQ